MTNLLSYYWTAIMLASKTPNPKPPKDNVALIVLTKLLGHIFMPKDHPEALQSRVKLEIYLSGRTIVQILTVIGALSIAFLKA